MRNPKNRVSVKEAVEQTDWVIDFMNVGESGVTRKVSSISALTSDNAEFAKALKSNGIEVPDTLIYVVNFADSLGFAIISADTRIDDPLIGFSGSGSLKDSIDNPGMAIFLEHLEDYMLSSIIEAERQKDSLIAEALAKLDDEAGTKSILPTITISLVREPRDKIGPLVPVEWGQDFGSAPQIYSERLVPVEWGQDKPFNDNLKNPFFLIQPYVPFSVPSCEKSKAGCVAVAISHIMSHWKYPASINGYSFNWNVLNQYKKGGDFPPASVSTARSQVANLMQQIGKGVDMDYGCDESGSNIEKALSFLRKQGFITSLLGLGSPGSLVEYNSNSVLNTLNSERPILTRGCSRANKFLGIAIYYDKCHEWVMDGLMKQEAKYTIKMNGSTTIVNDYFYYVHNNWGWDGRHNGYFEIGVFDIEAKKYDSDVKVKSTDSGKDGNYQYEVKIAPHIQK